VYLSIFIVLLTVHLSIFIVLLTVHLSIFIVLLTVHLSIFIVLLTVYLSIFIVLLTVHLSIFIVLLTVHLSIFIVLLTVHLSIFVLAINQLDTQHFCITICLFPACICFEYHVLIIRRPKCYYTVSGIITPIGGRPVYRTATYMCADTRCCIITFWPPDDEHMVLETCRGMK